MKKLIIALGIVGIIVVAIILLNGSFTEGSRGNPFTDALFTVRRGNLKITVNENGYLKAKKSVYIEPKFKREGLITWLAEEGTKVKEGDKLAEFDKTDLKNQIDELENSLIQYETELEAAEAELEIQKRDNAASIEKVELNLFFAEKNLERYTDGDAPLEQRKIMLSLEKAQSEYDRAVERFEQVPKLHQEGFLTKEKVEEEKIRKREAEINLENSKKEKELFEKYTFPLELAKKESELKDAERELARAKEKAEINLKQRQAQLTKQKRQVTSTKLRLDKLKEDLANMTVMAPSEGVIHYGDPAKPWYRDEIKVGSRVWHGTTLFTLPELLEMQVLVHIHEADIDLVKKDQEVLIHLDTYKGKVFKGRVTNIASVATSSEWGDSTNKKFRLEITMEPSETQLRAGITARVEIQVDEIEGVLQVPVHAVAAEEGKHFCFLVEGKDFEKREVKIGKNNAHFVEILEGLREGDSVLLYDPRETGLAEEVSEKSSPEEGPAIPSDMPGKKEGT